jgi:hypothetical protein
MQRALAAAIAGCQLIALTGCARHAASAPRAEPARGPGNPSHEAPASPAVVTAPPAAVSAAASQPPDSGTAPAGHEVVIYANCRSPTVRPSWIILTCADYGFTIIKIVWFNWTRTIATGTGTSVYNDCRPHCAGGHFHQIPDTSVRLTDPVRAPDGRLAWSRISFYPQPPGYRTGPFHGGPLPIVTKPI